MWSFQYKHGDRPLDGYTIQRAAGRGGFGEVYYAISDSGREVALKAVQGYEQIELRGISQCMNLKSPHLVTIFDVKYNDQGRPFVIMEYVSGPSLRQLLDESPAGLGEQKAAFFLREIAKGLTFLHDCGIVHRDLKPGNIFYENGYVKIGDYGLSKAISTGVHSGQTVTVGTVHYMAPEIGVGKYDRGIDIYALGAVLYEMLTGTVPFVGASPSEILMKHLSAEPDCTGISEPFATAIKRAMHKDPTRRFQSVQEIVEAVFGAEHVRNSMSVFSAEDLSMVAGRVAQKVAAGSGAAGGSGGGSGDGSGGFAAARASTARSSSVTNDRAATGASRLQDRFRNRFGKGDESDDSCWASANVGDEELAEALETDPMSRRERWTLAAITSLVVAVAAAVLSTTRAPAPVSLGFTAFLAAWGATLGLTWAWQRGRHWGGRNWPDTDAKGAHHASSGRRWFVSSVAFAASVAMAGGGSMLPMGNMGATWVCIGLALFLCDTGRWISGWRDERVSLGAAVRAGMVAWIASMIFNGSFSMLAIAIVSGSALMSQVLAPWAPPERRRRRAPGESGDAKPIGAGVGAGLGAGTGAVAGAGTGAGASSGDRRYSATLNIGDSSPANPPAAAPAAPPVPIGTPVSHVTRIVWMAITALLITGGLMLLIAAGTGSMGDPEKPPAIALGVSCLIGALFCFWRMFTRYNTGWWPYLVRPMLLMVCVQAIVSSAIVMGNADELKADEKMIGTFFIIFPAVMMLMLAFLRFGRKPLAAATDSPPGAAPTSFQQQQQQQAGAQAQAQGQAMPRDPFNFEFLGRDLNDKVNNAVRVAVDATDRGLDKLRNLDGNLKNSDDRRRARRELQAARQWRREARAARSSPGEVVRAATSGLFASIASLLIFASFALGLALTLDLPGFVAAGLPRADFAGHVEKLFGYPEWPSLARRLGAASVGITMVLGIACMMFARRRGGLGHMMRGALGAGGLLLALTPIAGRVVNDVMWHDLAPLFQTGRRGQGIDMVLSHFGGSAPYWAGGIFLFSIILLAWPESKSRGGSGASSSGAPAKRQASARVFVQTTTTPPAPPVPPVPAAPPAPDATESGPAVSADAAKGA